MSALSCSATQAAPEPLVPKLAIENIRLPQVNDIELGKFLGASMLFVSGDDKTLQGYDLVTRCSISVTFDEGSKQFGSPALHSLGRYNRNAAAPSIAANAAIEITAMLQNMAPTDTERCTNLILGYYGSQYDVDAREFAALSTRAVAILKGASLDSGPNVIPDPAARRVTEDARARLSNAINTPLFLGAIRADKRVALVLGEPGATVRWVAQFLQQPDGAYAFEGAMDVGVGDE